MTRPLAVLALLFFWAGCGRQSKEQLFEQGVRELRGGNPRGAVVYLKNALERDANYSDARFQLGKAYGELGKLESAEREFAQVRNREPSRDEVTLELSRLRQRAGKGGEALEFAQSYLGKHPGSIEALEAVGCSLSILGKRQEAEGYLLRALRLDPERARIKLEIAALEMAAGNDARARGYLEQVVGSEPGNLRGLYMLASLENRGGNGERAAALYQAILKSAPSESLAQYRLGLIRIGKGQLELAEAGANALLKGSPENPYGQRLKGIVSYYRKNYSAAASSLLSAQRSSPTLEGHYFLGLCHYRLNMLESALSDFRMVLNGLPAFRQARLMVGQILLKQGRGDDAAAEIRKAVEADDKDPLAHNLLGSAYLAQGLFAEGRREFDKAKRMESRLAAYRLTREDTAQALNASGGGIRVAPGGADPRSADARLRLGSLLEARGEFERATAAYRGPLRIIPESVALLFSQAALLDKAGRKKEAAGKYREILQKDEEFVPALNNLAYLCADGYGDKGEALRLAMSAYQKAPGNAGIMDTLGYALLRNSLSKDAVQVLEAASRRLPRDPEVAYHLGLAYEESGDRRRAGELLRRSIALGEGPHAKAARALLAGWQK